MWITKTKTRKPGVLPCGVWVWTRCEAKRKNGGPGDIKMKDMAGATEQRAARQSGQKNGMVYVYNYL